MRILACGFGGYCHNEIKELLINKKIDFPLCYLENNFNLEGIPKFDDWKELENGTDKIAIYDANDRWGTLLVVQTSKGCKRVYFPFKEIDTNRPWTLECWDGAYGIKYLDEYKLKDEKLNFYEGGC